jgi:DNA polymerase III alpha subunit
MSGKFDVDIDFRTDFDVSKVFPNWAKASIIRHNQISQHACGVFPQRIAIDPISKLSAIHYEDAEEMGFFKLDCLHNSVYNHFQSREEILELLKLEPDWSLLLVKENVEKLFQLSRHYELLIKLKPNSVEDLADAIALIRPGKASLIPLYLTQKETVRKVLYKQSEEYSFKKSHAFGYALVIVLQLHLLELGLL